MRIKRWFALSGTLLSSGLVAPRPVAAQVTWQYNTFDGPAASTFYLPYGINNAGTIVGTFSGQAASGAFIAQGNNYTTFGDANTQLNGINNLGVSTGSFYDPNADVTTPFVRAANGTFTTLLPPAYADLPTGINDAGQVIGYSSDFSSYSHGVLWSNGVKTFSDYPGANVTSFYGINNAGNIVGDTNTNGNISTPDPVSAFVLNHGVYTPISVPGANFTYAAGINNADQILGHYQDAGGFFHGFLLDNGALTTLDYPNIDALFPLTSTTPSGTILNRVGTYTTPLSLNDREDFVGVVGAFYEPPGGLGGGFSFGIQRGFIATAVPEPDSIALLAAAGLSVGLLLRRRAGRGKSAIKQNAPPA